MLEACPISDALITWIPADEEPLCGNAAVVVIIIIIIISIISIRISISILILLILLIYYLLFPASRALLTTSRLPD